MHTSTSHLRRPSRFLVVVAAGVLGAASVTAASAATLTVNASDDDLNLGPNGNCTLREAIQAANTNAAVDACDAGAPGLDTITLPSGTYTLSIAGAAEDANATGDLDALESVSLVGAGSATTIVTATALGDRILQVAAGATVMVSDVTLSGGRLTTAPGLAANGGGIANAGTLKLVRAVVTDNQATGGSGTLNGVGDTNGGSATGGAIYSASTASLTLDTTTVSGNAARGGNGGFACCSFSCSCQIHGSAGSGGAGAIESLGALTMIRSTIEDNLAAGGTATFQPGNAEAGGLHVGALPATVRGTTFARNSASVAGHFGAGTGPTGRGGAIVASGAGPLTLDESLLSENGCSSGDGLSAGGAAAGGAMAVNAGATVTVTNTTFAANVALGGKNSGSSGFGGAATGGAIDTAGALTLKNVTFTQNQTTSGTGPAPGAADGAALYSRAATTVVNSIVAANQTQSGASAPVDEGCDGTTAAVSQGGNVESPANTCLFFGIGDQRSVSAAALALQPLANNGGATQTAALGGGSVAIDAAQSLACPSVDQRHYARTGSCDVGAYEAGATPCTDADLDGYYAEGGACGTKDCNDTNASVSPGGTELPGNGLDDDCNPLTPGGCSPQLAEAAVEGPAHAAGSPAASIAGWIVAGWVLLRPLRARRRGRR
ncbi:MAG: putative metal-binding motif-containing protein [Deltaproteobacteria bacterium]|nr:putative metal-binding motif-containing protein [Deltaproteobacteria bacterium]